MILAINDWRFDVDIAATMEYSAKEAAEHCDCAYCRNFYAAVDNAYPELRPFLAQFGVDIEAPEELMPFDATLYLACYCVNGRILSMEDVISPANEPSFLKKMWERLFGKKNIPYS